MISILSIHSIYWLAYLFPTWVEPFVYPVMVPYIKMNSRLDQLPLIKHKQLIIFLYHFDLQLIEFCLFLIKFSQDVSVVSLLLIILFQELLVKLQTFLLSLNLVELSSELKYCLCLSWLIYCPVSYEFHFLSHFLSDSFKLVIFSFKLLDSNNSLILKSLKSARLKILEFLWLCYWLSYRIKIWIMSVKELS